MEQILSQSNASIENETIVMTNKKLHNIHKMMKTCFEIDGKPLMQYIAKTLKEQHCDLLYDLYKELGKEYMINIFEKTLNIENEGGMLKKVQKSENNSNEKRTPGGIFFNLIRNNEKDSKIIKKIFRSHQKMLKNNNKVYKQISQISID